MIVYVIIIFTIDWLHMRDYGTRLLFWDTSHGREVLPMDMNDVLTLMISFGVLIALIMSDKK
ncbi:hypothetical protein GCM10008983_21440 [Lentibacillus halophilus]|uniref:Uncharacterized protein n=1 Tax=Lentibacillus halophilus TaxID=295065 RepID=A0ABP3J6Y8_9BACI